MKKEYDLSGENSKNKVEEPAVSYNRTLPDAEINELFLCNPNRPCVFTDEEKFRQLEQGMEDIKNKNFIAHENILQKIKRRNS